MSADVPIGGTLRPGTTLPITEDTDTEGGMRVVPDLATRNAINPNYKKKGMLVCVQHDGSQVLDNTIYILTSTPPASDVWTVFGQVTDPLIVNKLIASQIFVPMTGAITNVTYYVNTSTGNNSNDGLSTGTAWLTLEFALEQIPTESNNKRYFVFMSGSETLSAQYTFKNYHSNVQQDNGVAAVGTTFLKAQRGAINIVAEGTVIDTVTSGDVTLTTSDPNSGIKTFTTTKNWTLDQMRDRYVIDSLGNPAAIISNTAGPNSTITICSSSLSTNISPTFTIYDYGAALQSAAATSTLYLSYGSASISFIGLNINNTGSGVGVTAVSAPSLTFQACKIKGLNETNMMDSGRQQISSPNSLYGTTITKSSNFIGVSSRINNSYFDGGGIAVAVSGGPMRLAESYFNVGVVNIGVGGIATGFNFVFGELHAQFPVVNNILALSGVGFSDVSITGAVVIGDIKYGSTNSPASEGFVSIASVGSRHDAQGDEACVEIFGAGHFFASGSSFSNTSFAGISLGGTGASADIGNVSGGSNGLFGYHTRDGVSTKVIPGSPPNTITGTSADINLDTTVNRSWADFYGNAPVGIFFNYSTGSLITAFGHENGWLSPFLDNAGKVGIYGKSFAEINSYKSFVPMPATITDVLYYVNSSTGNDANVGSIGSPWLTLGRALEAIPVESYNTRYTIFLAGTFTLSTLYAVKNYRSNIAQDFGVGSLGTTFPLAVRSAINIVAEGTLQSTVSSVTGTATEASSGLVTYTVSGTPWTAHAFQRAAYVIDTATGNPAAVVDNTANTITLAAVTGTIGTAFKIYSYGAQVTSPDSNGTFVFSYGSAPITLAGLDINNTGGAASIYLSSAPAMTMQATRINGLSSINDTDENNFDYEPYGATIYGSIGFENTLVLAENCVFAPNTGSPHSIGLSGGNTRFLESYIVGGAVITIAGNPFTSLFLSDTHLDSTASGIILGATGQYRFIGVNVSAVGSGINAQNFGTNILVSSSTIAATGGGFGVSLTLGARGVDGGTNTITGGTNDLQVGSLTRTYADFTSAEPLKVMHDFAVDDSLFVGSSPHSAWLVPRVDNEGKLGTTNASPANDRQLAQVNSYFFGSKLGAVLTSGATITPTSTFHHVSGTATINTITVPYPGFVGPITLFPNGVWALGTSGNIAVASTAVVNKPLFVTFDGTAWYPSY